jgi:hypothetical protein
MFLFLGSFIAAMLLCNRRSAKRKFGQFRKARGWLAGSWGYNEPVDGVLTTELFGLGKKLTQLR